MDKIAEQLVDAFLASKQNKYTKSYKLIQKNKEPTGENILVLVIKTTPQGEKAIKEFSVGLQKAVAGPKGMACPMCGGSGKS